MKDMVLLTATLIIAVLALTSFATAGVPPIINYQGFLTNPGGQPLSGTYSMTFTIYDDPTFSDPGNIMWQEDHSGANDITVTHGQFSVLLGSLTPLSDAIFSDTGRYLGIKVDADPEISPRTRLATVPYAFRVATVDSATGGTIKGDVEIKDGKLGIGIATPGIPLESQLVVFDDTYPALFVQSNNPSPGASGYFAVATAAALYSNNATAGDVILSTGCDASGDLIIQNRSWDNDAATIFTHGPCNTDEEKMRIQRNGHVGIGTETPTEKLHVFGGFRLENTTQADGYVLTSDAFGVGTWQPAVGGDDFDWELGAPNPNVLFTMGPWGIARYGNTLHGTQDDTHVNLGVASTTGAIGQNHYYATVSGGYQNTASNASSTVGGGYQNTASGLWSTVGGGRGNTSSSSQSTIGGGRNNAASDIYSTVGGGQHDTASAAWSTVAGGIQNTASGQSSTVGGGRDNTASGHLGSVVGGGYNRNLSERSVILGGAYDTLNLNANVSMAFGTGVYVSDSFRVVFFDNVRPGRLGLNRDDRDGGINYPIHVGTNSSNGNGAYLTNGGTWTNGSSRSFKDNFQPLDGKELLEKVANMPVEAWRYKDTDERHIGPYADDFVAAFDVGAIREEDGQRENHYLAASDVAGVALIGVQELYRITQELDEKTQEIEQLKAQMAQMQTLVETVLAQQTGAKGGSDELALDK